MKKLLPLVALLLGLAYLGKTLLPPRNATEFDLVGFGRLPVVTNGRVKPLDTVARTSLLQFQGRQRVSSPEFSAPLVANSTEWLLDVFFRPEKADTYPTFKIENPEVLNLIGKNEDSTRIAYQSGAKKALAIVGFIPSHRSRFSFDEIAPFGQAIEKQAHLAQPVEAALRTPFQRAVLQLLTNIVQYQRLKHTLVAPGRENFVGELMAMQDAIPAGVAAIRAQQAKQPHDEAAAKRAFDFGDLAERLEKTTNILAIPPAADADSTAWRNLGTALLDSFATARIPAPVLAYAGLARAWREQQPAQFNKLVELYRADLAPRFSTQLGKTSAEARFNAAAPFDVSLNLFLYAFLIGVFSWLVAPAALTRSAFYLVTIAWVAVTAGILTRMWLEFRPPVTNLYSSALFIGWACVGLCLILEKIYKNSIGSVAAGATGFCTLLVADKLSLTGDTLEMMRAVLNNNFWLATHVVTVTIGYSATFLAGFLAIIYVGRGLLTRSLDKTTADALTRMVYGIVCFATLFSFVGTVLGGIWADQSWGRFWGWDPKENGALIIVVWNALILHARWGGLVKSRGLMALAVFGNVVTSWSWFGTNMLGVGLHSYGFTDAAFLWLSGFILSQLAIIGVALIPLEKWRSFRSAAKPATVSVPPPPGAAPARA